jgi:stress response protein YsnF
VVSMGWERLLERMDDDKLDDKTLSILTGIATDKWFAAMNIPTQRVQVVREDTTAIRDAIRDAIREAKPALSGTTGTVETEPTLVIA